MSDQMTFNDSILEIETHNEVERITERLRKDIQGRFRRRGAVLGVSGGVDSAVVLALCVQALGAERVLAVLMPERESNADSLTLARSWANRLGVESVVEDITDALVGAGCYQRRDDAIQRVFPQFESGWKSKITLPGSLLDDDTLNIFTLTIVSPEGKEFEERVLSADFYQIVAASNFKQRMRMTMLYYHAELRNFAVVGTAPKNEHDLGFFVKHGDGGVDIAPIQHLFKSQVYQLAAYLEVPEDIRSRTPTSDTYSAGSTQEEFFFRLPFRLLDLIWAGWEREVPPEVIAEELGLTPEQIQRVIDDLVRKNRTTEYLRTPVISYPHFE
ncbi:NAD+ synthase [Candidatus Methanophagaceae archaeon]|nr:NAD+ synthase [Methanophagales archaeon]